jgi:pyruvate dehydrogenase E2 component (dihydrolipoamide acetyltransferase)
LIRFEFKLPDIGEGMIEGEIVKWHVKVGDQVSEDAPVLDVMTDKATVTISSPKSGKVLEIAAKEGDVKKVGTVLFVLEIASSAPETKPAAPTQESANPPAFNGGKREQTASPASERSSERVMATPATRRLAHELGVDLEQVSGTGPSGRITHEDVRAHLDRGKGSKVKIAQASSTSIKVNVSEGDERVPFRGLRRKIAEKMVASKTNIPHFTYVEEADVSELVVLREKSEAKAPKEVRLTYLSFIVKAVVLSLKKFPMMNSVLDEERQEIVIKHQYNIGIGVATNEGLTVPVVRHADQKDVFALAGEIQTLAEKARVGKLSIDELQGSTFTITSLGPLGGMFATPIINYPEVAILGIHRIQKRPVVRDEQIVIRDMMYVSLSFDHRVIDGDVGARFANDVIEKLEHPASLWNSTM